MLSGSVKSFNPHKGYGFITHQGKDIFLDGRELKGIYVEKGTSVQFTTESTEKGIQARNISVMMNPDQATYLGEIKSFNPSKGYGFISSEAFPGQDIFVLKTDLPEGMGMQGARCKFKVEMTEKGPNGKDVYYLGHHGDQVNSMKNMGGTDPVSAIMIGMMMQALGGQPPKGMGKSAGMGASGSGGAAKGATGKGATSGAKGVWNPMFMKKGTGKGW